MGLTDDKTKTNCTEENADKLTSDEIKAAGLSILIAFDQFAKEHNLRYWLAYGTLLGAARHQGFIPWDDDIDIFMPDDDYVRLVTMARETPEIMGDDYRFMTWAINHKSHLPYMKIYDMNYKIVQDDLVHPERYLKEGMFIDIFPLVGHREDKHKEILGKLYNPYAFIRSLIYPCNEKGRFIVELLRPLIRLYGNLRGIDTFQNQFYSYIENCAYRFDNSPQTISAITTDQVFEREPFDDPINLTFEGMQFPAPRNYKEVLSITYGDDWTELPPVEDRWCHPMHVYRVKQEEHEK